MQTMSVTRALAELKRIDDRIARATNDGVFVAVSVGTGSNMKVNGATGTSVEQIKSRIQSSFDTIADLFKTRSAIKAALVKSNATTMVKVGVIECTVAEAIEMKRSVASKVNLVAQMKRQQHSAQSVIATLNAKLEADIDSNLKTVYGSDKGKVDPATFDAISKPQKALKEAALIDPVDIVVEIGSFEEEISLIETELDYTLSSSNAMTNIQF